MVHEIAKILVDAYEEAGFDTSNLTACDLLFGLIYDGEETGEEAYRAIRDILAKEIIDSIKAGG